MPIARGPCAGWAARFSKARPGSPSGRDFLTTIATAKEYATSLDRADHSWHGQETGHNNSLTGRFHDPRAPPMQVSPCSSALCLARPVADRQGPHDPWGHANTSRLTTCTRPHRRRNARSSEIGRARCGSVTARDLVPTYHDPAALSTAADRRAKKTGNTRRTLITAVAFRALALDVFYHGRWLDFKGRFLATYLIPAQAGIQTVGHRTPCVTSTSVARGLGRAGGMERRRRCLSRTGVR